MSSSLNVLTTRPTGLRGSGPANRPRQATYYWKDPITTCSSRLRALSTRPSFVSHLLICCGLLIFLPLSLWAELGETVQDNTDAALLSWPRVRPASSQELPSFAHSCRRSPCQDPAAAAGQSPARLGLDLDRLLKAAMPVSPIALQFPVSFWFRDWVIGDLMQAR